MQQRTCEFQWGACCAFLFMGAGFVWAAPGPDLNLIPAHAGHRLQYNHPGLVVDLGAGLWANPMPMDFDNDGDMDLLVSCADVPARGLHFFENDGSGVFKPARILDKKHRPNVGVSYVDGEPVVCEPGVRYDSFRENLYEKPVKFPFEKTFHSDRDNQWRMADYDGDGKVDLLIGASDWREYGWDDAFDAQGRWTAGPLHGYVYWVRNTGANESPLYGEPQQIEAGGAPVDVYGCPSPNLVDWDGDGDLDLICGSFLDTITWFENTGSRMAPVYAAGRLLTVNGAPLHLELEMLQVVAVDWDKDGDSDLVVGLEDGRVVMIENTGPGPDGKPRLAPPAYLKQQAQYVKCGALATPEAVDWDQDGDEDILCGNTAGFLEYFENLGGDPVAWAAPVRMAADGEVIRFQAGPNLSIQGPAEAKWGYSVPAVGDWDMDGLPDVICNSIVGRVVWFRNVGAPGKPDLAAAQPLEVAWEGAPPKPAWLWWTPKPGELVTQWRTKPCILDLNQDGLTDLVMVDHEGFLAFFERSRRNDALVLLPGKRIFHADKADPGPVYASNGKPLSMDVDKDGVNDLLMRASGGGALYRCSDRRTDLDALRSAVEIFPASPEKTMLAAAPASESGALRLNAAWAGGSGRRKLILRDWDGDGRVDLLANGPCVNLMRNVGEGGSFRFQDQGALVPDVLAGHDTCPTTIDLERDGKQGLLVGAEDGFLYYYPR